MSAPVLIPVGDASQIGEARRLATAVAAEIGFSANDQARVSLVVTEMATNLARHARDGRLVVRPAVRGEQLSVRALAIDSGPGMDLARCLRDGYSTAGTAGNGLGAIQRMSDVFDAYSEPGSGTVLFAECTAKRATPSGAFEVGAVCLPKVGEEICGDAWAELVTEHGCGVMVVDGLGHGPDAAHAAREAIEAFRRSRAASVVERLRDVHEALRGTRGAAVGISELPGAPGELEFAAIGNVAAWAVTSGARAGLVSMNGIAGHELPRLQGFRRPWSGETTLVVHSDGLSSRWETDRYPGLWARHPEVIAGLLFRDAGRARDDATVVIARLANRRPKPLA